MSEPNSRPRIRGFLGEQSFEITEGTQHLQMFAESSVFSSVYRVERDIGHTPEGARAIALRAIQEFRSSQQESES